MRPAYFTFELLARITGDRLQALSDDDHVHAFLSYDSSYRYYSLMFWNFSSTPVTVKLNLHGLPETLIVHRRVLDAATPLEDENARIHPLNDITLTPGSTPGEIHLQPYGIEFWSLEPLHWRARLMAAH
jgi:hypothetical protein